MKIKDLRRLLSKEGASIAPGAYNALTAKLIEQTGFSVVYATGAGIANTLLGLPDVGLVSFGEMRDQIRYIVEAVKIPVITGMRIRATGMQLISFVP